MKKLLVVLLVLVLVQTGNAQIVWDKDQCNQCNMLIRDNQFAALALPQSGENLKFDAIECLINFLKNNDESTFLLLQVADYANSGKWIDAKEAIYLKSAGIPSPMGAYLTAYSDRTSASKVQNEKGGELFSWSELKAKFKDSNFGLLNHPDHHQRSDAYASIGIMGDHLHHKDSWMISLRHMYMSMDGNQMGTREIANDAIYNSYMAAPQNMSMQMYMLGIMYAPLDNLTISLMLPYLKNNMSMQMKMTMPDNMGMGGNMPMTTYTDYETQSSGVGDLKLSVLYGLWSDQNTSFHLNMGISIPQGNIKNTDRTPMSEQMKLPYTMQLGSGSLDILVGATFKQSFKKSSVGIQPMATIRTNKNEEGYQFGNLYKVNGWYAYGLNNWLSLNLRTEFTLQEKLIGVDAELNKMMAPQSDNANYGYEQINTYIGFNFSFVNSSILKNMRAGFEVGSPLYRNVSGIQMNDLFTVNSGVRYLL